MVYTLKSDCVLVPLEVRTTEQIPWEKYWYPAGTFLISLGEAVRGSQLIVLVSPTGDIVFTSEDLLNVVP